MSARREWVSVADARAAARRRLPRMVFDFVDGGAGEEITLRRNLRGFEQMRLAPRVLVDVSQPRLATRLLGEDLALPLICGPTGMPGISHPGAEVAAASAAARIGVPFTVGTTSSHSVADVACRSGRPPWFQLYAWRDRAVNRVLLDTARDAGVEVLVLTVDTPVPGVRERDRRNGMTIPPRPTPAALLDAARHPRWALGLRRGPGLRLGTLAALPPVGDAPPGANPGFGAWFNHLFNPSLDGDDLAWLRSEWPGQLVVKGLIRPDDARRAADAGADAVVVSNHGGRQLDGAPATVEALPSVVAALSGTATKVLIDGGVRSGHDIACALAIGADAVLVGRPWLYGLAARGAGGVEAVLGILRDQLATTLQLLGCPDVGDLDAGFLAS